MFNDIFSLANSFGTTFGLRGNPEPLTGDIFCNDYILKLEVKEELKDFVSEEDAKEIFDLVAQAFLKGSKPYLDERQLEVKFDKDNLTVVQINHYYDNRKNK